MSGLQICAALCWYDEDPSMLSACVQSLAGVADRIVALDGPYADYPYSREVSTHLERQAIIAAADQAGLRFEIGWRSHRVWRDQTEKRAELIHRCREWCPDWVLVIDADERVAISTNELRLRLEATEEDVAEVGWLQGPRPIRRLFRCLPDLTVRGSHNGYHAAGRWLHTSPDGAPVALCASVASDLILGHAPERRSAERRAAAQEYRRATAGAR